MKSEAFKLDHLQLFKLISFQMIHLFSKPPIIMHVLILQREEVIRRGICLGGHVGAGLMSKSRVGNCKKL